VSGWQDIETAPKDGTAILVWGPMIGHIVVEFDDSANDPDFPWGTLDGPNYFTRAFAYWHALPALPSPDNGGSGT